MAAQILDGKAIAAEIHEDLKREAAALREAGVTPHLSVVLVGDDPASHTYVGSKVRTAARLGIDSRDYVLPATTSEADLKQLIRDLSADPAVNGILIQSPLPPGLNYRAVVDCVDPAKDVDGLHYYSIGALVAGQATLPPCTPAGIMELLRRAGVDPRGKEAVVVGRSDLVGKPVSMLLLHRHATVTICHSRTVDLPAVCRRAEILVAAVGRPRMLTADYIREGAVVIDVGINRVDGKLVGDVDYAPAAEKASCITPVPGGVGPMTIAMLMRNTLTAARTQAGLQQP